MVVWVDKFPMGGYKIRFLELALMFSTILKNWFHWEHISLQFLELAFMHGLRTPREEIAFTARQKIQSQSQIFRYGRSIFCLSHRPNFSDSFHLCLHWVSVVRGWYLRAFYGGAYMELQFVQKYFASNIFECFDKNLSFCGASVYAIQKATCSL